MSAQELRVCSNCDKPLPQNLEKFCSRDCLYAGLRKRILVTCTGCRKSFQIKPYLKRKTNYCSVDCYHHSTFQRIERECVICHGKFVAKNYSVKKGFGKFCSRECQNKTNVERRQKVECKQCGKMIIKSPSVAKLTKFCSEKCRDDNKREYVSRICHHCGKEFQLPTWETRRGKGMFCSRYCYIHYQGESSIETTMRQALERLKINFQQEVKFGRYHADFVLPERKIVIECDGYWHSSSYAKARDGRKDKYLQKQGYKVLRFDENQIKKSALNCLKNIKRSDLLMPTL